MNTVEKHALLVNDQSIRFARPGIALAIRHYKKLEKFGSLLRREIEPRRKNLQLAQARQDEIEADHELLEAIKLANRRKTDSDIPYHSSHKYGHKYSIGSIDQTDLAEANDPLTGAIITKS